MQVRITVEQEIFLNTFLAAREGDQNAIADLLGMFMPVLESYSYVNGKFDEDLLQLICIQFVQSIPKFRNEPKLKDEG